MNKLNIPKLTKMASNLMLHGKLAVTSNNLVYLDIDDLFIHKLFPMLQNKLIKKPNYFGKDAIGAHITVVYPEEHKVIEKQDLNQEHHFTIKELVAAEIDARMYYVLLVDSDSLLQLRRKYLLPDLLCFKGYSIGFHITIGVVKD